MARLRYRPSTRVKQFNPSQLSQQGITELRRRSDRMIRGLENNLQAEKEQQERDRAAMKENAALSEERIQRDRAIEEQNLRNEQISLSKQESVDRQQLKYDFEAENTIFESIAGFAKTAAAKAAENHANMVKDQTEKAKNANIEEERKQWNDLRTRRAQGAIQSDVDTIESDIENQRPLIETFRGILSNNGRGDIYNEIVLNRLILETFDKGVKSAFESTERIYTDAQGNKFSGAEAYGNATLSRIVTDTVHNDLKKQLGADTAVEGYLDRSETAIEKKKQALADRANQIDERRVKEQIEFQAQTLNSGGTAEDHLQAYSLRVNVQGQAAAHVAHRKLYENPNNDRAELDRMGTFLEGGQPYSQGRWAEQVAPYIRRGDENEAKAYAANQRLKRAQWDEQTLQNRDAITEFIQRDPVAAEQSFLQMEADTGIQRPTSLKLLQQYSLSDLETQDRAKLQFEIRNSTLSPAYINDNIKHPTVKKEALAAYDAQEKSKYGPDYGIVEPGLKEFAKKAAKNAGSIDMSSQANLIQVEATKWLQDFIRKGGDARSGMLKLEEMYGKAKADLDNPNADKGNLFYQKTNEYNNIVYPNIQEPKYDSVQWRTTLLHAVGKNGANVPEYAFSVETQEETDRTLDSARILGGTPIFSDHLITAVDMLNKANPEKKRLTYTEFFNQMQEAKSKISGKYHPPLDTTFNTQVIDALSPKDAKTYAQARRLFNIKGAERVSINATAGVDNGLRLRNRTRASMPGGGFSSQRNALEMAGAELGVDPIDLATIISFETGGTFDPGVIGGQGNNYQGLIQFGIPERQTYGVIPGMTFEEQLLGPVIKYFKDRFAKAGMSTQGATLEDLYTTVLAGNPGANRDAADSFGTTARSGAARMFKEHRPAVIKRFGF